VSFDDPAACRLLPDEGGMTGVLLTTGENAGETIIALGAAVFITDDFLETQKKMPQPGAAERILASALGPNSPVLRPPAIHRLSERHGLSVAVVLHQWDRANTGRDIESEIRIQLTKAFLNDFRGYRLRELLTEVLGEEELRWAVSGGFMLRHGYDDWYRAHQGPTPRRYLIGADRKEALSVEGTILTLLFHYREPVCRFSRSERRLLQVAVTGATDSDIAAALGISLSVVKKRWTAIFERVRAHMPDLVETRPSSSDLTRVPRNVTNSLPGSGTDPKSFAPDDLR
jgi:hypothetical protein